MFGTFRHFSSRRQNIFIVAKYLLLFGILCFICVPNFIKFHTIVLSQIEKRRSVLFMHLKFSICIEIAYEWQLWSDIVQSPCNIFKSFQNRRIEWDGPFQINFTLKIQKLLGFRSYDVTATRVSIQTCVTCPLIG